MGLIRPQSSILGTSGEGGPFLRWMLRGSGMARVIGSCYRGPNFRCEVGGPAPLTPLLQAQDNHSSSSLASGRACGLGDFVRVCVTGGHAPLKKNGKMSTMFFWIFGGALVPSLRVRGTALGGSSASVGNAPDRSTRLPAFPLKRGA